MIAALARALLREDRDFHTIQDFEAAVRLHSYLGATPAGAHALIATARYLAAHSPRERAVFTRGHANQHSAWRARRLFQGSQRPPTGAYDPDLIGFPVCKILGAVRLRERGCRKLGRDTSQESQGAWRKELLPKVVDRD